MCKFESSHKESRTQSADFSKAYSKHEAFIDILTSFQTRVC